jgi:hypothetical protein
MNFRIKNYISILAAATLFASCSKNYLDQEPTTAASLSTAIQTESDLGTAVTGAYSVLRNTDLYGRTLPVKGDLMADNTFVTTANSGRYLNMNSYNQINSDAYALAVWTQAYTAIKYANTVINNATIATTATGKEYLGEAYAIRALMHFELVRNFAHPYTIAASSATDTLGIPIVTSFNQSALPGRNSIKAVYAQVISDLEAAYSLMTTYRGTAYFSKYAARALEARVYQTMGDWANAKTTALDVVTNSGFAMVASTALVSYFNNPAVQTTTKNETLFEVSSDINNNNQFDQIGFIYLTAGGGYGDILVTADLYNTYAATDVRKGLIQVGTRSGQSGTVYLCYKYPNAANTSDKDDTKVLRLADVILIAAEAYYNSADYTNANLYLNMVAKQRDPSFAGWSDNGAQVLEDILVERRKELAFEGSRFWDLLRLKRSFTKVSNQNPLTTIAVNPVNYTTSPNTQIIFPIPQAELNANPNIATQQNPGY